MQNERKVLVSAILKAENEGYSNIILNKILNESNLEKQSKAFVTAAFYGVLERKLSIDYLLNKHLKKPVCKAPPYTAAVLRSGVYQIVFMERVPNSAAVNEAVKLIKKSKEHGNSGLVNAVLRKISNENCRQILNNSPPDIKYSVLSWIYDSLVADYGKETAEEFLENSLFSPPTFIKINTTVKPKEDIVKQLENDGFKLYSTEISNSYKISGMKNIEQCEAYKNGLIYVQDFSSAVCAAAVDAKPGMRILDACAAPGGKTFSMAVYMENKGEIVSCDIHGHRVKLIADGAERLNLDIVNSKVADATAENNFGEFDRVLCDVPCSGIGVIRRKPEIKYKSEEECNSLPKLQFEILKNCAKYVKKGGRLIYSTCTLLKNENENVVAKFLKENKDFVLAPIRALDIKESFKTFMPPKAAGDGFFIAAFERK